MQTNYTADKVFSAMNVNFICDLMYRHLFAAFPPQGEDATNNYIRFGIVLSGRAAMVLQDEVPAAIENIVFQTDKEDVFAWLQQHAAEKLKCKSVKFKNRILLEKDNVFYEIWMSEALNAIMPDKIAMQNKLNIPDNLK